MYQALIGSGKEFPQDNWRETYESTIQKVIKKLTKS